MRDYQITYEESLKAFLDGIEQPRRQQAAVFIAARAALRVVPMLHGFFDLEHNKEPLTPLPLLRPLLISSVAATMPTDDIKYAAARAAANAARAAARVVARAAVDAARVFDAANADSWRATQRDAELWVEHADAETVNLSIDIAPLWDGTNPLGADWSFWITWYQGILDGTPQNWPLIHEIATTYTINWDAPAQEVNDKINEVIAQFTADANLQEPTSDPTNATSGTTSPPIDIRRIKSNLSENAPVIPPALDTIEFLIENEIRRLQEKNYQDDLEAEESKRLIGIFLTILAATQNMSQHIPNNRDVSDEDAKAAQSLINVYQDEFSSWARTNAPDVVDGTCRAGLVGCATGVMVMLGAPVMIAATIGGFAYGGERLKGIGKAVKEAIKN